MFKIATLNIDWARKYRSKTHYLKLEKLLGATDFDFLILTEAIKLNLPNYSYQYFTDALPQDTKYENLNYVEYLKGEKAFRCVVYSKHEAVRYFSVKDSYTSMALEFSIELGKIILYTTIIGTWFNKQPFAQSELNNCIDDCERLVLENKNLFIVGDLNTSFLDDEQDYSISKATTKALADLFEKNQLHIATKEFRKNIDHIIVPKQFVPCVTKSEIFVEKGLLSDHQGLMVELELGEMKCRHDGVFA